jgi:3(or 17)beta-hydroxysteroid dehydrogenase
MGRVAGKVAIVTGAASGIGKAACFLLSKEGASVAATDIDDANGRLVAEELVSRGRRAIFIKHDVSREDDWTRVVENVMQWSSGKLDVLVNNAGVILAKNVEELELEDWRWLMSINLDGVFLGTKKAIETMKSRGGGSIINISSVQGIVGAANFAAYNASKGGVRLLTKSVALHCGNAGYNIRVNSIHPSYTDTPMMRESMRREGSFEAAKKRADELHPIGRIGNVDDVAWAILYLASDESKFMTGSELVIDGGFTAQ